MTDYTKPTNHRIEVGNGMSGYYAMLIADYGFYPECIQTGIGRYDTAEEAAVEGREWAKSENIRYVE